MPRLSSKYSPSQFFDIGTWVRTQLILASNGITDRLIRPALSDIQFAFICGCGHSGTTLTAAKLGRHTKALLIGRESGIFLPSISSYCTKRIAQEWRHFAHHLSKAIVLEKTPKHIHCVRRIFHFIPSARIIVTTRNPMDNIASLFERFGDLEACIKRWVEDNREILRFAENENVKIVKYEDILLEPIATFQSLTTFLDLEWDANILDAGPTTYEHLPHEENMQLRAMQVRERIASTGRDASKTFDNYQLERIRRATAPISIRLGYA